MEIGIPVFLFQPGLVNRAPGLILFIFIGPRRKKYP